MFLIEKNMIFDRRTLKMFFFFIAKIITKIFAFFVLGRRRAGARAVHSDSGRRAADKARYDHRTGLALDDRRRAVRGDPVRHHQRLPEGVQARDARGLAHGFGGSVCVAAVLGTYSRAAVSEDGRLPRSGA